METKNAFVLVLNKDKELILLEDLLNYYKGKIDPKHVAWMMSRLHNIVIYLNFNNLSHNNISLKTCFIHPEQHSIHLLGGWWYSQYINNAFLALPNETLNSISSTKLKSGIANPQTDLALIRKVGCKLIGDTFGINFFKDKNIPIPLVNWLCTPGTGNAQEDYRIWYEVILIESFGKRKYQKLNVSSQDVYKTKT